MLAHALGSARCSSGLPSESHGQLAVGLGGPEGSVPDDAQSRLALPFVVFDTDLDASLNEVGGSEFLPLLGVEADATVEVNQTPSPHEDAGRSCSLEDKVVSDPCVSGRNPLETRTTWS